MKSGWAPPYLVSYAITKKCNLKCKHCYSDSTDKKDPNELNHEEAKKTIDQIAELGPKLLIFDGGEPLEREDFLELCRYATSKKLRLVVGSNGTLIDREMARKMKESGVMAVQISLDGADPKTHDDFRGVEGSWKGALEGAENCKKEGLAFQFGITIRKSTLKQVPELLKMSVEMGASAAEFFDLVPVKRVKESIPDEVLSPEERKEVMEYLARAQEDCPIVIRTPGCPMYTVLLREKKIVPRKFPAHHLHRIPYYGRGCAAGMPNGYLTVLPDGTLIPCMLLQIPLGNVRENDIKEVWQNHPVLLKLRSKEVEGKCKECEHREECLGCRGRAYEETGDYMAEDPGCWMK